MKNAEEYRIHLNFLPIVGELPEFEVHRKLRARLVAGPDVRGGGRRRACR